MIHSNQIGCRTCYFVQSHKKTGLGIRPSRHYYYATTFPVIIIGFSAVLDCLHQDNKVK